MYCRKAKLKLLLKFFLEEYKMCQSEIALHATGIQGPSREGTATNYKIGVGNKKVVEEKRWRQRISILKKLMAETQTDSTGLGSSVTKWWSKSDGIEKRDSHQWDSTAWRFQKKIQKSIQPPQQGQWTNWDNALQKSLLAHGPTLDQLSYQISVRSPALQCKPGRMGKEKRSHLSAV